MNCSFVSAVDELPGPGPGNPVYNEVLAEHLSRVAANAPDSKPDPRRRWWWFW